jgi:hypothetical protein
VPPAVTVAVYAFVLTVATFGGVDEVPKYTSQLPLVASPPHVRLIVWPVPVKGTMPLFAGVRTAGTAALYIVGVGDWSFLQLCIANKPDKTSSVTKIIFFLFIIYFFIFQLNLLIPFNNN